MAFPVYSISDEDLQPYLESAYQDISAAVECCFEHFNNGRPIILAGFSQGSQLLPMLMEEYFDAPAYSDRLIAAYCIGWSVTEEDIARNPHLAMAQGEDDTGAIGRETAHLTGAYPDREGGALRLADIDPADYSNSLFPDGVYHLYGYRFFYRDLQKRLR